MKSKMGLRRNLRILITYIDSLRFTLHKHLLGFESANNLIKSLDKASVQHILKRNGAVIGKNCDIETGLTFHNCADYKNLIVGENCHIGKNCFFDLRDKVIIKNNVGISMQSTFITHIDFAKSDLSSLYPPSHKPIIINDNCILGARATVLMGVEIGEGSLIPAGSIISRDIPPHTMAGSIRTMHIKKLDE